MWKVLNRFPCEISTLNIFLESHATQAFSAQFNNDSKILLTVRLSFSFPDECTTMKVHAAPFLLYDEGVEQNRGGGAMIIGRSAGNLLHHLEAEVASSTLERCFSGDDDDTTSSRRRRPRSICCTATATAMTAVLEWIVTEIEEGAESLLSITCSWRTSHRIRPGRTRERDWIAVSRRGLWSEESARLVHVHSLCLHSQPYLSKQMH